MTTTHGGRGWLLARELGLEPGDVLDLSASLNPLAPDPLPVVAAHLDALRSYPDPGLAETELAAAVGVDSERLVLTNGGAEAIALVAGEFPAGSVEEPEFSLYRRHLRTVTEDAPRWRSNPNNPTGLLAGDDDRAAVWDEAFWPLATGSWTRGDADSGSITVGSLTKLLACPGLRAGYIVGPDGDTAGRLRRRRPQWSVNGLVCAALPELLRAVDLPKWATGVKDLRAEMAAVLTRAGYPPRPSDSNWLLVDSSDLEARLAANAICVRDCASFGLAGTVRIAVPGPDGIERLERAL